MRWSNRFTVAVLGILLSSGTLPAADIYVIPGGTGAGTIADPAGLQAALDAARVNGEDDTLYLHEGTYDAGTAGADTFEYDTTLPNSDGRAVTLSGSWEPGFTYRHAVESDLDGGGTSRALLIKADAPGALADVRLEYIAVKHGKVREPEHGGGVLALQGNGGTVNLTVTTCVFEANVASEITADPDHSVGGAIAANCPVDISDTLFKDNWAYDGGAVYLWPEAAPSRIAQCRFEDNLTHVADWWMYPYGGAGGAIYSRSPDLAITGCEIIGMADGSSSGEGGAVHLDAGAFAVITGTAFRNILNQRWGAGLELVDAGAEVIGCLFANNHPGGPPPARGGYGALSYLNATGDNESITILDSTFTGNLGAGGVAHGAVYLRGGDAVILNSIFWDNGSEALVCGTAPDPPAGAGTPCTGSIDASIVQNHVNGAKGFTYGGKNLALDPLFALGDPDHRLQAASPCIGAGVNVEVPDALTRDFEGDPRIFGYPDESDPVVDMGWDEFYDGRIDLTSPGSPELWRVGSVHDLSWESENLGTVRLELWAGTTFVQNIAVGLAGSGTYPWTVPEIADGDYRIAVRGEAYETVESGEDVSLQHLTLAVPNGGEVYRQGSAYPISWASSAPGGGPVAVELWRGSTFVRTVKAQIPDSGASTWTVPFGVEPGADYRLRLTTADPVVTEDWSDAAFTVLPAITVTAPNGGQSWRRGSAHRITWTFSKKPGAYVRILLLRDGVPVRTIARAASIGSGGRGRFLWTVPRLQLPAATYRILVRSTAQSACFDVSDEYFAIVKP